MSHPRPHMVQRMGRHWMILGLQLGYPPCCIAAFVRGEQLNRDYEIKPEFDNTGYVPCRDCARLEPAKLIEHINAHRISEMHAPFPNALED